MVESQGKFTKDFPFRGGFLVGNCLRLVLRVFGAPDGVDAEVLGGISMVKMKMGEKTFILTS